MGQSTKREQEIELLTQSTFFINLKLAAAQLRERRAAKDVPPLAGPGDDGGGEPKQRAGS